ncbi:MAG TPA: 5-formyltetrahydrofolate cyclo-ligase [Verrucomicrobiae bacterium]|nr:5-formyltetrahydrofolate cyclo-ligase [Verrucomicrobiae bacterium]
MESAAQKKIALRERMRARLASQSPAEARAKSAAIWERLSVVREFSGARRLLSYVSTGAEVDTHGLIRQLLAMGRHVCVPRFDEAQRTYVVSEIGDFDGDLMTGKFGILEPRPEAMRPAVLDPIGIALVPGLAFDETGNRLGRGLGHFDRLLRQTGGVKIALAFDFQLLDEVPAETHDMRMDFIVTETRVVNLKGNRK